MVLRMTLVVSEPSATADQLCAVLNADQMPAWQAAPGYVMTDWSVKRGRPDLLLINAGLDVEVVRRVSRRIMQTTNPPPTIVVFVADDDFATLEPHVSAGMDYIVPPYLTGQVRSRLIACHFRQALSRTAEEIQTAADLLHYERELQIGREIQEGFLPEKLPTLTGWQLTVRFLPAREVAGDFYDAFELRGGTRIGLVVADVCDKGVGAALFMALIRSLLRHAAIHTESIGGQTWSARDPAGATADVELLLRSVRATNDYLIANHLRQAYFATLFFGVLNPATGSLVYINCGHNPPVLRRLDGGFQLLWPTGPALGLMPDSAFAVRRTGMEDGDLLFVYTDGVPEARDAIGRTFGREPMLSLVCAHQGGADDLLARMEREVDAHVGLAERYDDITMVALSRRLSEVLPLEPTDTRAGGTGVPR
jgi:phosphoserine phosphatase RsbU/P